MASKKIKLPKTYIYAALTVGTLLLFVSFALLKGQQYKIISNTPGQPVNTGGPKIVSCTRTSRLDNAPQYDRALSLLQQRISDNINNEGSPSSKFTHYPPSLTNCINIIEDYNNKSRIEGSFSINSKNIKSNYYPITVNSKYKYTDDAVTALLLSHEITHVQQYIDTHNGKPVLQCVESEVEAYVSQYDTFIILNSEEQLSIEQRMDNLYYMHPQIHFLNEIFKFYKNSGIIFPAYHTVQEAYEYKQADLRSKLRELITNDSDYKKQCNLK